MKNLLFTSTLFLIVNFSFAQTILSFLFIISCSFFMACSGGGLAGTSDSTAENTESSPTTSDVMGDFSTVTIGNQTWASKNLDVSKFRNGDAIPLAKTDEEWSVAGNKGQAAWCYYDNDPANGIKYGKLYNWYAVNDVRGLAPKGFHIPSFDEWTILTDYLGGKEAITKMRSNFGWKNNLNGTNSSGFAGFPGGLRRWSKGYHPSSVPPGTRLFNCNFNFTDRYAIWWCSTDAFSYKMQEVLGQSRLLNNKQTKKALKKMQWGAMIFFLDLEMHYSAEDKGDGGSVRCVKD
jgi:uncharacterized protein (TIGR02145 family)